MSKTARNIYISQAIEQNVRILTNFIDLATPCEIYEFTNLFWIKKFAKIKNFTTFDEIKYFTKFDEIPKMSEIVNFYKVWQYWHVYKVW